MLKKAPQEIFVFLEDLGEAGLYFFELEIY